MRKLIAALAFLCLSAFSFGQTAVVTGHTITGQNTTSASGISILFELIGDNGQQCKVAGTGLITPYSSTVTQAQLAAGISLIENSQITCGTTTGATRWRYTIKSGGTGTRQCVVNITAATNLDSTACLNATSTPVTTTPTDSIYCRIDGSNCGLTGAVTDTASFGAPLFNVTGSLNATIANDTAGGVNVTTNGGKTWEFANGGNLGTPLGLGVQFNGATSGVVIVAAPAVAGANNLTLPAATDTLVGKATTDTLTNKTLTSPTVNSPAINGQTADTITQKAATQFLLKDNTGGTRLSIPSNGTSPSVLNNTAIGGGSTYGGTTQNKQIFTSSGTFTIPANVTSVKVTVIGAGGGGGGAAATPKNGGGGGSGSAAIKWLSGLTPGNTLAVTIGAAGAAGTTGANGGAGGASSVASGTQTITSILTNGGAGGNGTLAASPGGGGGTPTSGGDLNLGGSSGGFANSVNNIGGNGAPSIFGGGAGGSGGAGIAGQSFGDGGGGAGGVGANSGGAGSAGVVVIEWTT